MPARSANAYDEADACTSRTPLWCINFHQFSVGGRALWQRDQDSSDVWHTICVIILGSALRRKNVGGIAA